MKYILTFRNFRCIIFFIACHCSIQLHATIHYVNVFAAGNNTGTSWTNAFTDLQVAIDHASVGDTLWVGKGTYFPSIPHGGNTERHRVFYIDKSIRIYGGFEAVAGTEGQVDLRDVKEFETILSADIGETIIKEDNAFHVVWLDHVGYDMVLDGFTIRDGHGHDGEPLENYGAGIYNDGTVSGSSSPAISNCTFIHNSSGEIGGAVANLGSDGEARPTFLNCHFISNTAGGGGAVANLANPDGDASPFFINCIFKGNTALTAGGGAIQNIAVSGGSCSPVLYNCVFSGNLAPTSAAFHSFANDGGTLFPKIVNCTFSGNNPTALHSTALGTATGEVTIKNSIFYGNGPGNGFSDNGVLTTISFSLTPFGFAGDGSILGDPLFVNPPDASSAPTTEGDLHISSGSPAIDAGNPEDLISSMMQTDVEGNPRFINPLTGEQGLLDLGAYEFQPNTTSTQLITEDQSLRLFPNPASTSITLEFDNEEIEMDGFIQIFSLQGSYLLSKKVANVKSTTIDISRFSPGTYFLLISGKKHASLKSFVIR